MPQQELTTKLVIDLVSMKNFGSQGESSTPIDISPFTLLALSDYSSAWNGFNTIIRLPADTTLSWELVPLGPNIGPLVVSGISVVFKLVGSVLNGDSVLSEWKQIFDVTGAIYNPDKGTLEIQASDFVLAGSKPHKISASISTVPDLLPTYNLTYSITMSFTDGAADKKQVYFMKIDPLIKNNSDPPVPRL